MKKNQELFKEAIADANDVRSAALANAKKVLEEALTPKVQNMLNKKLAEIESKELEETEEKNESLDKATGKRPGVQKHSNVSNMEEELESILQELGMDDVNESEDVNESDDLEESSDEDIYEGSEDLEEGDDLEEGEDLEESDDLEENEEEGGEDFPAEDEPIDSGEESGFEGGEDVAAEPEEVVDLTVDQLSDIIRGVVQDVISGGGEAPVDDETGLEPGLDAGPEAGAEGEEEVDLDELIAELGDDVHENEEAFLKEAKQWYMAKKAKGKSSMKETKKGVDEAKAWYMSKKAKGGKKVNESGSLVKPLKANKHHKAPAKGKVNETEKDLKEALRVVKTLQETLNSTNLLNAKLLYVNKIFKAKNLNETQKIKVVSAFDKARTKQEAKMIYESLNETLNSKKQQIKESIGFASKSVGGTAKSTKDVIVEDATVKRFQKLAGLN